MGPRQHVPSFRVSPLSPGAGPEFPAGRPHPTRAPAHGCLTALGLELFLESLLPFPVKYISSSSFLDKVAE